jgi:hypothetical protein
MNPCSCADRMKYCRVHNYKFYMKRLSLCYSNMAEYQPSMSYFLNNWELVCTRFCFTGSKSFLFCVSSHGMNSPYTYFIPRSSVNMTNMT